MLVIALGRASFAGQPFAAWSSTRTGLPILQLGPLRLNQQSASRI